MSSTTSTLQTTYPEHERRLRELGFSPKRYDLDAKLLGLLDHLERCEKRRDHLRAKGDPAAVDSEFAARRIYSQIVRTKPTTIEGVDRLLDLVQRGRADLVPMIAAGVRDMRHVLATGRPPAA